ncbi:DUF4825 domain-containing protein [Clostridium sp. UBA4548]|uniref:DUF4825 domain-containing protein n=1 Tax=Clostridium sp. UBA4548 TaxID=1946361 RepID=UPI0025BA13AA|nr:DUF4825 domain-containing protein [Clostridium sp. UBA4548]
MKNKFKVLVPVILTVSLSLIGCGNNSDKISNQDGKTTSQIETYDLIKYKDSYVGDNSSVGNIIAKLPGNEYNAGFSLQTDKEPYGITINYKAKESLGEDSYNKFWSDKKVTEFLEKNAVVLLSLVQNAEVIEFNVDSIGEVNYKYDRKSLEQKYGGNLKDLFKNDNSFKNF